MNNVNLIGRITKDVELRTTQSGKSVVAFTLAVDRMKKDSGADFVSCVAWERTADNMEKFVRKGDLLGISGHLQTRSYEDKNGKKVFVMEVIASEVKFCGGKRAEQAEHSVDVAYSDFEEITVGEDLPY